jgi:GTPase
MTPSNNARAGRVAIVGRPNAGKSTLLNALLGQKLAIVAPKPGTTRSCLLGVYMSKEPLTQIAFIDTPGLERPRSVLGRVLAEEAKGSLEGVDAVVVLVDASRRSKGGDAIASADAEILAQVENVGAKVVLALNKVDLVGDKGAILPKLAAWNARFPELAALVPISAQKGTNIEGLVREIRALLPEGLLYDDEDFVTDKPERFFAAELVREAIIHHTREEVPYSVAVQIDQMKEEGELLRIGATIFVDKASHKGILIGAGGARLKAIGTDAREEIERFTGKKVFLQTWVKVEEDWTRDAQKVRRLTREST